MEEKLELASCICQRAADKIIVTAHIYNQSNCRIQPILPAGGAAVL